MKKWTLLTAAALSTITLTGTTLTASAGAYKLSSGFCPAPYGNGMIIVQGDCSSQLSSLLEKLENCYPSLNLNPDCILPLPPINGTPDTEAPDILPEQKPDTPEQETPDTEDSEDNIQLSYIEQIVELVNEARAENGLAPVTLKEDVSEAAQVRTMEIQTSFSHTRPNGSHFSTALKEAGVNYRGAGENIAWGQPSPEEVMDAWMNSAGHRANILNASFTSIGVGHYQNSNGVNYWTQLFTY